MKPIKNLEHGLEIGAVYKTRIMPAGYQRLTRGGTLKIDRIYVSKNTGVLRVDYHYLSSPEPFTRDYDEVLRGVII